MKQQNAGNVLRPRFLPLSALLCMFEIFQNKKVLTAHDTEVKWRYFWNLFLRQSSLKGDEWVKIKEEHPKNGQPALLNGREERGRPAGPSAGTGLTISVTKNN